MTTTGTLKQIEKLASDLWEAADNLRATNGGMPVQKFRSIEEMNEAPDARVPHTDFERFLRHCARYWAIAPRVYPRGVFKFRTIEDAQGARERHQPSAPATSPDQDRSDESGFSAAGTPVA